MPNANAAAQQPADTIAAGETRRLLRNLFAPYSAPVVSSTPGRGPVVTPKPGLVLPKLSGIFLDGSKARAIIDDRTVSLSGGCVASTRLFAECFESKVDLVLD